MSHNGVMNTIVQEQSPSYDDVVARIDADPEGFWLEQAKNQYRSGHGADSSRRRFECSDLPAASPTANSMVCFNAVDRHVAAGRGDQAAIIYDSPVTGTIRTITYAELLDEVSRFARALADRGVVKGDRVIIYMAMVPEAAIAMLACARLGAIHSVVFGGFAPNELAVRIDDTSPKAVISTSCGVEKSRVLEYKPMVDEAIDIAENKPEFTVIVQRDEHRCEMGENDLDYAELLASTPDGIDPVTVRATDELYVLYTSGTTGKPRASCAIPAAMRWPRHSRCPASSDSIPATPTLHRLHVGWVVGHTYIVYAPLLAGVTSVLLRGSPTAPPYVGTFFPSSKTTRSNVHFTAPTAMGRWSRKEDPDGELIKK